MPLGHKKATTDCRLSLCRDDKIRTCDPYVPNVVRYQLRYIPIAIKGYDPKSVCKGTHFF